jgi:hypothetical protein
MAKIERILDSLKLSIILSFIVIACISLKNCSRGSSTNRRKSTYVWVHDEFSRVPVFYKGKFTLIAALDEVAKKGYSHGESVFIRKDSVPDYSQIQIATSSLVLYGHEESLALEQLGQIMVLDEAAVIILRDGEPFEYLGTTLMRMDNLSLQDYIHLDSSGNLSE